VRALDASSSERLGSKKDARCEVCFSRSRWRSTRLIALSRRKLRNRYQLGSPATHYHRLAECPRISHKREADNGSNKMSSTPQSSASHHNSAVLVELTSTMGMELEIHFTCSTRSVQLPSGKARSATTAVLSDADASKSLAALRLFTHSTLRPRRCKSCS